MQTRTKVAKRTQKRQGCHFAMLFGNGQLCPALVKQGLDVAENGCPPAEIKF